MAGPQLPTGGQHRQRLGASELGHCPMLLGERFRTPMITNTSPLLVHASSVKRQRGPTGGGGLKSLGRLGTGTASGVCTQNFEIEYKKATGEIRSGGLGRGDQISDNFRRGPRGA